MTWLLDFIHSSRLWYCGTPDDKQHDTIHLLLSEPDGFLHGNGEFLVEGLERLVCGQIETVETAIELAM
jgi:hypothetical protein